MNTFFWIVVVPTTLACIYCFIVLSRHPKNASWPDELDRLIFVEKELRMRKPLPLVGRPDEVYTTKQGALISVDTKTRKQARYYPSDVVQLTVYRWLLMYAMHPNLPSRGRGRKISNYGYLRCVTPSGEQWVRVPLKTDPVYIQKLIARQEAQGH